MPQNKTKEYTNGEITVVWKPRKCVHSGICVRTLPEVYKPNGRPWIQIENANSAELEAQVKECPSGALTYYYNDSKPEEAATDDEAIRCQVMDGGPLLVFGDLEVTHADGSTEQQSQSTAFCRCGQSSNQPYCDGSHKS